MAAQHRRQLFDLVRQNDLGRREGDPRLPYSDTEVEARGDMRFLMRQAEMVQVLLKAYSQGVDTTWPKGRPPYDGVG